jgi:hypothetical protein
MSKMASAKCLVALLLCMLSGFLTRATSAGRGDQRLLSLSLASEVISLHEPVIIEAGVSNVTTGPIQVDFGDNRKGAFHFKVTRPDGRKAWTPAPEPREGLVFSGVVALKPGESFVVRFTLDEWFDFSELGDYLIEGELGNSIKTPEGTTIEAPKRFRSTLKVVPRDGKRLRSTCASLTSNVLNAASRGEAADFAEALSRVNDPVAVPYLQQLLQSGQGFEQYAIAGLQRVGDLEAVRILIKAAETMGDEEAHMARYALGQVQAKTTDSRLKLEIEKALNQAR